jgi:hypothetical protein
MNEIEGANSLSHIISLEDLGLFNFDLNGKGIGVFANKEFEENQRILSFRPEYVSSPTRYTIQTGINQHLVTESNPGRLLNHSCNPNCYFDVMALSFFARRAIQKGEELTFDYLTTEWEMATPFNCSCGATDCVGHVQGYKYLGPEEVSKRSYGVAPFLNVLKEEFYDLTRQTLY